MLIDGTCIGEHSRKTIHVVRRTKLRISSARRAAGDTVAAVGPGPSHRIAHRDVDCVRDKLETTSTSYHDVESRAVRRWNAVHGWLAVSIENADGRRPLCVRCICSLLAGFGPHQNSKG